MPRTWAQHTAALTHRTIGRGPAAMAAGTLTLTRAQRGAIDPATHTRSAETIAAAVPCAIESGPSAARRPDGRGAAGGSAAGSGGAMALSATVLIDAAALTEALTAAGVSQIPTPADWRAILAVPGRPAVEMDIAAVEAIASGAGYRLTLSRVR